MSTISTDRGAMNTESMSIYYEGATKMKIKCDDRVPAIFCDKLKFPWAGFVVSEKEILAMYFGPTIALSSMPNIFISNWIAARGRIYMRCFTIPGAIGPDIIIGPSANCSLSRVVHLADISNAHFSSVYCKICKIIANKQRTIILYPSRDSNLDDESCESLADKIIAASLNAGQIPLSDYESLAVFGIPSAEETVDILLRLEKEILA